MINSNSSWTSALRFAALTTLTGCGTSQSPDVRPEQDISQAQWVNAHACQTGALASQALDRIVARNQLVMVSRTFNPGDENPNRQDLEAWRTQMQRNGNNLGFCIDISQPHEGALTAYAFPMGQRNTFIAGVTRATEASPTPANCPSNAELQNKINDLERQLSSMKTGLAISVIANVLLSFIAAFLTSQRTNHQAAALYSDRITKNHKIDFDNRFVRFELWRLKFFSGIDIYDDYQEHLKKSQATI